MAFSGKKQFCARQGSFAGAPPNPIGMLSVVFKIVSSILVVRVYLGCVIVRRGKPPYFVKSLCLGEICDVQSSSCEQPQTNSVLDIRTVPRKNPWGQP